MLSSAPKQRILVPQRVIQGGFDVKFDTDSNHVSLHGLLTPEQYADAIQRLNDHLKAERTGIVDGALLATGPLMVPLAVWGVRHRNQMKRRKRKLGKAIKEFNAEHPKLFMQWNHRPESALTIERRRSSNQSLNHNTVRKIQLSQQQQQKQWREEEQVQEQLHEDQEQETQELHQQRLLEQNHDDQELQLQLQQNFYDDYDVANLELYTSGYADPIYYSPEEQAHFWCSDSYLDAALQ